METSGKRLPAALLLLLLPVLGFLVGGLLGGRVLNPGIGFDGLASMLSGMAIGIVAGLSLGILLVARLERGALARCAGGALVLVLALGVLLIWQKGERDAERDARSGNPAPNTMPIAPPAGG